jgi:hypothetical protein
VTKDALEELAHRAVHEALEQRGDNGKLTGEWVVFAKHDGKNYYLSLNAHHAGDQNVHDCIMQLATKDFPDLSALKDAAVQAIP